MKFHWVIAETPNQLFGITFDKLFFELNDLHTKLSNLVFKYLKNPFYTYYIRNTKHQNNKTSQVFVLILLLLKACKPLAHLISSRLGEGRRTISFGKMTWVRFLYDRKHQLRDKMMRFKPQKSTSNLKLQKCIEA